MTRLVIDVQSCTECPCLRFQTNGDPFCFYNDYHTLNYWDMENHIDEQCPLKEEE